MVLTSENLDEVYNFPPLFTLQPNEDSRVKQFKLWGELLVRAGVYSIQITDSPPVGGIFNNAKISRRVDSKFLSSFCEYLERERLGKWLVAGSTFLFYQKPLAAWAEDIQTWVLRFGKSNSVESVKGLVSGPDSKGESFHGIPEEVVIGALDVLEAHKKCEVFHDRDVVDRTATARFVYEVCSTARLPHIMYTNAMMIYHAFCEYTRNAQEENLLVASTCLLLAVKFGENIINSSSMPESAASSVRFRASSAVVDATARVLLWYGSAERTTNSCAKNNFSISVENLARVRKYVAKCFGDIELSILKITGNYLTNIPSAWKMVSDQRLRQIYASPSCLNFPPDKL